MIEIRLKEYLKENKIDLVQLSKDTGIRHATLHAIYSQKVERLNLNYLDIIMTELNIKDMNVILKKTD